MLIKNLKRVGNRNRNRNRNKKIPQNSPKLAQTDTPLFLFLQNVPDTEFLVFLKNLFFVSGKYHINRNRNSFQRGGVAVWENFGTNFVSTCFCFQLLWGDKNRGSMWEITLASGQRGQWSIWRKIGPFCGLKWRCPISDESYIPCCTRVCKCQ